jgi:hypothetical protein
MTLSSLEIEELRTAKLLLEDPGLAAKISNLIGAPIEKGFELLPRKWSAVVHDATRKSIETALDVALWTMDRSQHGSPSNCWHVAGKSLSQKGAPAIIRLITEIASRFSIVVSQKMAAQAVPLVGAFGGAVINTLFIDHFQDMGKGHFTVRRLERTHGAERIHRLYTEV